MSQPTTTAEPTAAAPPQGEPGGRPGVSAVTRRLRGGELGAWPVIIGLIVIWIVFQSLNSDFLTAQNLSNMTLQIASTGIISVGVVLVLLLGEIDLSVASVAGVAAASLAVMSVRHGWPEILATIVVLLIGAAIGLFQGSIFARLGVPAFVVTLAGNIGWLGLQLWLLSPEGTINIPYNGFIADLTHTNMQPIVGWIIGVVIILLYALAAMRGRQRRVAAGLPVASSTMVLARIIGLAVLVLASVAVLNAWHGVPLALLIFIAFVVGFDLILRRTTYGRKVFSLGGNIEAARRAGINVAMIRISVFVLASTLAAVGGVLAASRGYSASQTTPGPDVLLVAIAAAVIGGTSLFGGRGSTYSALLGSLVLGSITSGMLLLQLDSSVRYMITAAVLLAAVILDSLARRGRRASGRE